MTKKVGKWTRKDKEFILANADKLTVEQIAEAIGRNPSAIRTYINGNLTLRRPESKMAALQAEYEIQKTPIWRELQQQFSPAELDMFLYHWKRILGQFRDDVFPTEEIQIVDTIKAELLMSRSLEAKRKNEVEISSLIDDIQIEMGQENPDTDRISALERQRAFKESAASAIDRQYTEMAKRKDTLMKDMKATREQRVKNLESSKTNIVSWIKDILQDVDRRTKLGRDMEKMRLATDVEVERISDYFKYEDNSVDRPFLTPEILEKEDFIIEENKE